MGSSKITEELTKLGAKSTLVTPKQLFLKGFDVVVYTVAISETHPEFVFAKSKIFQSFHILSLSD